VSNPFLTDSSAPPVHSLVADDVRVTRAGTTFTVDGRPVTLALIGERFVDLALDAIAAQVAAGNDLTESISAVETVTSAGEWSMTALYPAPGILVINDAAEATADSTSAALKTLAELALDGSRSIAVLGELSDTGDEWREEHDRIGRLVVRLNIAKLVVVGDSARHIHNAAGLEGSWDGESLLVGTPEEAYDLLINELHNGDVVLVKSSRAAGLGALGDRLGGVSA